MENPRIPKASILHACIIKQQLTIHDFEKEIKSIKVELTAHEESASQEHRGFAERNELLVRIEHELEFLKKELISLEEIDPEKSSTQVEAGAVVATDQRIFFISTSIEQVDVNGFQIVGISLKAPIYPGMKGKKSGESFEYGGVHYRILDVY